MDYSKMILEELEKLVYQKDGQAICEMAERYRLGIKGVEKNLTKAYDMYHKGEKMGLKEAYKGLGDMYANGEYFSRNPELAERYYKKAGPDFSQQLQFEEGLKTIDLEEIRRLIDQGEELRKRGSFVEAKGKGQEAIARILNIKKGCQVTGTGDPDELQIHAYWLIAFAAFNDGNFEEMERYLSQPGVYALHPWGAYLTAMVHNSNGASQSILEEDMSRLLDVSKNPNMTPANRGDVLGMIADFYRMGLRGMDGDGVHLSYTYYSEAARCGNGYAAEKQNEFEVSSTGRVTYVGKP